MVVTEVGGEVSMDDARLDHLRLIVENASLEMSVDEGELTIRDVAWLIERVDQSQRDLTEGPIDWHVKSHTKGVVTFTMRSSVRPTTWLSMYVDRAGWDEIRAAFDKEMVIAEGSGDVSG